MATLGNEGSCKHAEDAVYNFGPTTDQETNVCGAARPGAKQQRCYEPDLRVTADEVAEWVAFMKERGVGSVVAMLSASELETYAQPLPAAMQAAFGPDSYVNVDAKAEGGPAKILAAIKAARAAGKKVLVHCWGGGGRTGLVQAAWLVTEHGMSAQQAADAVTGYAAAHGLARRVDVGALQQFVKEAGSSA